jgi:hypothetical protein
MNALKQQPAAGWLARHPGPLSQSILFNEGVHIN